MQQKLSGLGLVVAALSVVWDAQGAGFELREQSATGQGASFAGVAARADDPSMIFWNPAAMAWLPGTQGVAVGSGIFPYSAARTGNASRNPAFGGSPISGSLGGDAGVDAFVPALHATTALGAELRLGLSITSPWGLVTKYPSDFIGRYYAQTSSLRTINIAPAVSWQVRPNLAFGAALQIQYASARLSQAFDFGALIRRPGFADGRTTVTGDNTAVGWQIGAQWEPVPGTRLGAAFRSAVFHDLSGDTAFQGVPAALATDPVQGVRFANGASRAKLTTPETATLGLSQRLGERWTLLAGAEWTNWSRFRDQVVRFEDGRPPLVTEGRWRDSWFLSLGAEYQATPQLALRAGFAWDQSPVPAETRMPSIPDNDRYWLSIGAGYQVTRRITVTAAYTHIFAENSRIRLHAEGADTASILRGNLNLDYRRSADIIALQTRFAF